MHSRMGPIYFVFAHNTTRHTDTQTHRHKGTHAHTRTHERAPATRPASTAPRAGPRRAGTWSRGRSPSARPRTRTCRIGHVTRAGLHNIILCRMGRPRIHVYGKATCACIRSGDAQRIAHTMSNGAPIREMHTHIARRVHSEVRGRCGGGVDDHLLAVQPHGCARCAYAFPYGRDGAGE